MSILGLHSVTILALLLAVYFAFVAGRMARGPVAPPLVRFAFAGLPLLVAVVGCAYLVSDLGLLGP